MSPGMVKVLLWAGIILTVCYAANVDPFALIGSVVHALQQMHNSNAGNP